MRSVKETFLYSEVLKEFNYPFGDIFIFKEFIVSEIKQEINYTWDNHAKFVADDVSCYLETNGNDLIYISNRINAYSVVPSDWSKFHNSKFDLKGYYVISNSKLGDLCIMVENLFLKIKIRRFSNIHIAVNFVKTGMTEIA